MMRSLKGFNDFLPDETVQWHWIEEHIRELMRLYGYGEVRLPIVESTDLFKRGVGEGTDIVGKEMYSFLDKSDPPESITLRPELTASAARAFVEHEIAKTSTLTRWYYLGPLFRYEQPQAGRYRQFHQFGVELFGSTQPEADVETITIADDLLKRFGIRNYRLRINSIGTNEERAAYRAVLLEYLRARRSELSEDSVRRMEGNALRVLDSKRPEDVAATKDAPKFLEHLGPESLAHFDTVRAMLEASGIEYTVDHRLVRGLDYYTGTVYEFQGFDLGAQDALLGGGRYDRLIEGIGGKPTPATGFGMGLERIVLALRSAGAMPEFPPEVDLYIVALDDEARRWAGTIARRARGLGLSTETDLLRRSMKAQMREANRRGARLVVIAGENELAAREAQVKDMRDGSQKAVGFDELLGELLVLARRTDPGPVTAS